MASSTESFTYDALSDALLEDGSTYFVYGADGLPLEQINGSTPLYYLHDQLGSTRALVNESGTVLDTYTYDVYGNLVGSTGTDANPLGFAGAYTDAETGFLYLINRYYDPATGQFLSVDPLVDETGQSYVYTGDDPVNGVDPLGLWPCLSLHCIASDVGVLAGAVSAVTGVIAIGIPAFAAISEAAAGVAVVADITACSTGSCNYASLALDALAPIIHEKS